MTMRSQRWALLQKKAEEGNARAQYELGLAYYRGEGVEKDKAKARQWLLSAAAQGDRDANVLLNLRSMELNQGVEFRFGSAAAPRQKKVEEVEEGDLYESEHQPRLSGSDLLLGLRQVLEETQKLLPGLEPMRDRLIVVLNAMIKSVESKRMPIRSMRDQITPSADSIELAMNKYRGVPFVQYKAKLIQLFQRFRDIEMDPPVIPKVMKKKPVEDKYEYVARLADQIEAELKAMNWWSNEQPTAELMNFTEAFGMDTMPLSMWIQFVLLPRVREIIEQRGGFPQQSMVGAHAVREYDGQHDAANLVSLLSQFDEAVERR